MLPITPCRRSDRRATIPQPPTWRAGVLPLELQSHILSPLTVSICPTAGCSHRPSPDGKGHNSGNRDRTYISRVRAGRSAINLFRFGLGRSRTCSSWASPRDCSELVFSSYTVPPNLEVLGTPLSGLRRTVGISLCIALDVSPLMNSVALRTTLTAIQVGLHPLEAPGRTSPGLLPVHPRDSVIFKLPYCIYAVVLSLLLTCRGIP